MLPEGEAEAIKSIYAIWNPCRSTAEILLVGPGGETPIRVLEYCHMARWGSRALNLFFLGWDTNEVAVDRLPFAR